MTSSGNFDKGLLLVRDATKEILRTRSKDVAKENVMKIREALDIIEGNLDFMDDDKSMADKGEVTDEIGWWAGPQSPLFHCAFCDRGTVHEHNDGATGKMNDPKWCCCKCGQDFYFDEDIR